MLGKTTDYAIWSLVYTYIQNLKGEKTGFKELTRNIDSPEGFTGKVLQIVTRAGMLSSMKGRGCGFLFNDPTNWITSFEVVGAVECTAYFQNMVSG